MPEKKFTLLTKTQSCLNCHLVQGWGWLTGQLAARAAQPMSQKCPRPQRHNRQGWVHRDGGRSLFLGEFKQGLGASYVSATAGEIYSGWR